MQSANPVLPAIGFAPERLLAPRQALVAFLSRVTVAPPGTQSVALADAFGRVLAQTVAADDDYPNADRSLMDGFALRAASAPGEFSIDGEVSMGYARPTALAANCARRIPTGGVLPDGADAVVPVEEARVFGDRVRVDAPVESGANVAPRGADMRSGETLLEAGRRIGAPECGLLATLGVTEPRIFGRPRIAVLSSGDELVEPRVSPRPGEVRDSNRYAIAASLRAMGAEPVHYPTLHDEAADFEPALARAIAECEAVVMTGGSSVGERDRLPAAIAAVASPGVLVHGLRVKPGKPTLLAAHGNKPILGLPGNPASALFILEAVVAPIVAALVGAAVEPATLAARLDAPARSRAGWTWYVPVSLRHEGATVVAHPLAVRSFMASLAARAGGYITMEEGDEEWPAGRPVTVRRFVGV